MVKSIGFLFDVFAKCLHSILAPKKVQRILNLSISTCTISTESGGNIAVNSFCGGACSAACVGLFLQTLKNRFKVSICGKGNFELLSAMESYKGILQRNSLQACLS